jgi:hypothetical protein
MLAELRAAQDAMREAARLTPEGLQEVFEDGFNKAMEAFDVQEKKLTLEYELQIADDQKIIEDAQNQIAAIQYEMDDYEADLRGIEEQEQAINKTYDEKLKALEDVRKANQKILDQEKGKLSVAEAITRGDLSAAARAVQDVRATSASGYFSSQTDALNQGRQNALDAVRGENGLSRIEIEERLEQLANQIFEIEENALEPATERVRLAGVELQSRIDELTVLGKTKTEWETIKNNIDVARVNSKGYKEAMEEALSVVQDTLNAWNGIQSKTVTLTTIQKTVTEGGASGGGGGGGGSGTGPTINDPEHPAQKKLTSAEESLTGRYGMLNKWKGEPSYRTQSNYNNILGFAQKITDAANEIISQGGTAKKARIIGNSKSTNLDLQRYAEGGPVSGPGTGTSDSIPAMLSNKEYVIKAAAAKKLGRRFLDSLNAGKPLPPPGMNRPGTKDIKPGFGKPGMNKPYPMPSVIPNNGMMYSGGSPNFNESTGTYNKPAFNKPSLSMPNMGMLRPSMPQIPSGPKFNVPVRGELKGPAVKTPEVQPPADMRSSVYNYNLSVNVSSQSDPNTIAQTVMGQLRMVDSQRIRGNRF